MDGCDGQGKRRRPERGPRAGGTSRSNVRVRIRRDDSNETAVRCQKDIPPVLGLPLCVNYVQSKTYVCFAGGLIMSVLDVSRQVAWCRVGLFVVCMGSVLCLLPTQALVRTNLICRCVQDAHSSGVRCCVLSWGLPISQIPPGHDSCSLARSRWAVSPCCYIDIHRMSTFCLFRGRES